MPSPIGHALAGVAIAWLCQPTSRPTASFGPSGTRESDFGSLPPAGFAVVCATLAAAPDLDLLYMPIHRTMTHSVAAALLVTIIASAVTGWVTGRVRWGMALACGAAYGSHVLLDWLGADASRPYGIQALWPFSDRWFIAPWPIFPGTERREPFSARALWINFKAAAGEIGIMGTLVAALWWVRRRRGSVAD